MKYLFFVAALCASTMASAGGSSGTVTSTTSQAANTNIFFFVAGTINATPTCDSGHRWAVSLTTPGGNAIMKSVLLAEALGKPIFVQGDGTCSAWGDSETATYVIL
jgi:hypothetical protein